MPPSKLPRQPLAAHLAELRSRLGWIVLVVLLGAGIGYLLRAPLLHLLVRPLGQTLYYATPGSGLNFVLKLCLLFGLTVALPVASYHLIQFISPIFPRHSTRMVVGYLVASCLLVLTGGAFAYFVSLPAALHFLGEYSSDQVRSLISTDSYLSFVAIYLAGFAILFHVPLVLLLINRVTPLSPRSLWRRQRLVILAATIVAAILTPTQDPVNLFIMAVPMVALYDLAIALIWWTNRRRPRLPDALKGKRLVQTVRACRGGEDGLLCQWEPRGLTGPRAPVVTFCVKGTHRVVHDFQQVRSRPSPAKPLLDDVLGPAPPS
jgi:sec-independent protein translocase protein TatC